MSMPRTAAPMTRTVDCDGAARLPCHVYPRSALNIHHTARHRSELIKGGPNPNLGFPRHSILLSTRAEANDLLSISVLNTTGLSPSAMPGSKRRKTLSTAADSASDTAGEQWSAFSLKPEGGVDGGERAPLAMMLESEESKSGAKCSPSSRAWPHSCAGESPQQTPIMLAAPTILCLTAHRSIKSLPRPHSVSM